jgi:hypothetical protein
VILLFPNFDFAPAKKFVQKKSPRQHGVPAQPVRGCVAETSRSSFTMSEAWE